MTISVESCWVSSPLDTVIFKGIKKIAGKNIKPVTYIRPFANCTPNLIVAPKGK
jgi:hypothetical protein